MKRRHSLSVKLLGLFLLTALSLSLVIKLGFEFGLRDNWQKNAQPHLAEYFDHMLKEIGDPADIARAEALAKRLPLDITIRGGGINWSSGKSPLETRFRDFHSHKLATGKEVQVTRYRGEFYLRINQDPYQLTFQPRHAMSAGAHRTGIITIGGVLLVLMLAGHAIRRLFRPIKTIREGLNRFGSGELDHRIDVQRHDELGELSQSVNTMAADIQAMLEAKRQLLLAISHELRSPLTRAKVNLELIDKDAPGHDALKADLNEIETLLAELLETERLNRSHAALNRTAVNPAALIKEVIEEHFKQENIERHPGSGDDYVSLDTVRIKMLIRNLLDNAIRHTPAGSPPPVISSELTASGWRLSVHDYGPGIPAEHLPHLAEPFYRADPSRQRETGGYGLGLYLCRMIAEGHGGKLEISNIAKQGARVSINIPLAD